MMRERFTSPVLLYDRLTFDIDKYIRVEKKDLQY